MHFRRIILWSAFVMLSAMFGLAPSVGASSSTVAPATMDATGTTDVTGQLQAFLDGVPDGSTISFPAGARYRIEGSFIIEGRHDLTFEGHGAEFFATTEADRDRRHWWIRNSDDITIRDVVVRGANPNAGTGDAAYRADREAQHGFDFAGVKNAVLERVTVTDVYGDFVYIGLGDSGWSKNVTVRDSTFERNGRQGISITAGQDVRIERNYIGDVRRSTFDIEPNGSGWGARRVTISDNDIGPGRLNFLAGHGSAGPVEDVMVVGNRLSGKTMNISLKAPAGRRRANFSLIGNVSDASFGSPDAAVKIEGFDGVMIRDNVLPLAAGRKMTAVAFVATCDTSVIGNTFTNAEREVKSDGYDCGKVAPTTTLSSTTPTTTSGATATTPKGAPTTTVSRAPAAVAPVPQGAGAGAVGGGSGAVGSGSNQSPSGASTDAHESEEHDDEVAEALPANHERLVDSPGADAAPVHDHTVWVLVIGAVISLAVLVPMSRRSR